MANKYLIHGATYCGDGTASNEAASAGAVGAWNDINVFEGTAPAYGSLAAGVTVYIRSKTSAGADITRTLAGSVTLGSPSATSTSWVRWIIDGGTIWSGINGTLKYIASSSYAVTLRNYNEYIAEEQDKFEIAETASGGKTTLTFAQFCRMRHPYINLSGATGSYGTCITTSSNGQVILDSPHISRHTSDSGSGSIKAHHYSKLVLINPDIELVNASDIGAVFYLDQYLSHIEVIGGRIRGVGATSGVPIANMCGPSGETNGILLLGTQYPKIMAMTTAIPGVDKWQKFQAIGNEHGAGAGLVENWGYAVSRSDLNHPTLETLVLPDSSGTPWSWRIYPQEASLLREMRIPAASYYIEDAAEKEITLEVLVNEDFSSVNTNTLWMDVHYIDDTTGEPRWLTTKELTAGNLTTSTTEWSIEPPSYGSITLDKYKFSITTPTGVKKDTLITATLRGTAKSSSANDVLFLAPNLIITAP